MASNLVPGMGRAYQSLWFEISCEVIQFNPVIDSLDEKYREAVMLTELEGLSQKELASKLNLSYTGAKSRVQRGRIAMKDKFAKYCTFKYDSCGSVIGYDSSCGGCK